MFQITSEKYQLLFETLTGSEDQTVEGFDRDVYSIHTLITSLLKGGIPAAPSGTATLLRLSPSHLFYLRQLPVKSPSSGTPSSHGLTGGVYKVRERIHRAMADARLLAIPPSWSRVADSNPNWDRV